MRFEVLVLASIISITSCSPKVVSNTLDTTLPSRSGLYYEPFALIEEDTIDRSMNQPVAQLEIKDGGLSINCDFQTVKQLAKTEALRLGGNCLVITEHRLPDLWSTCHRIKGDVFLIDNAKDFESEIIWHKNRQLQISDFKGSTEKRPFTAATFSSFRYRIEGKITSPKKYTLYVETFFDCYSSYFKHTEFDSMVLAHEQIHFDISELYARMFISRIDESAMDLNELLTQQEEILDEVARDLYIKQDEYDSEVYADRSKQPFWTNWIIEELNKYDHYADKVLIVDIKE